VVLPANWQTRGAREYLISGLKGEIVTGLGANGSQLPEPGLERLHPGLGLGRERSDVVAVALGEQGEHLKAGIALQHADEGQEDVVGQQHDEVGVHHRRLALQRIGGHLVRQLPAGE
jgi:hypothetical protein